MFVAVTATSDPEAGEKLGSGLASGCAGSERMTSRPSSTTWAPSGRTSREYATTGLPPLDADGVITIPDGAPAETVTWAGGGGTLRCLRRPGETGAQETDGGLEPSEFTAVTVNATGWPFSRLGNIT
jgi:hypothetical protein